MFAIGTVAHAVARAFWVKPTADPPREVFKGITQPKFFKRQTWQHFRELDMDETDV